MHMLSCLFCDACQLSMDSAGHSLSFKIYYWIVPISTELLILTAASSTAVYIRNVSTSTSISFSLYLCTAGLIAVFGILTGSLDVPSNGFSPGQRPSGEGCFGQPRTVIDSYKFSFFPSVIRLWNTLPPM